MKKIVCFLLALHFFSCFASTVDTINIYSASMKKNIHCVVVTPADYKMKEEHYPVVYLLHGYAGDYTNYIKKIRGFMKEADDLQMIFVCPDGNFSSWYFDSPVDSSLRYETFVSNEVPKYIDAHYRTIKNKHGRGIAGLSMGGHGALFLAIRHPNIFGACGSMSGVVDLFASHDKFDIIKRIGDTTNNNTYWHDYSVINLIEKYNSKDSLAIIIDCGVDDFTYLPNHRLHEKMLKLKIPHDYTERPGNHNWEYWSNAIKYQLLFFRAYFDRFEK
jgi:S-formylglutathione hydrolase FrmB